jgi:hypothetical protein
MNKIRNISMLCALLSAGSAVADPILSEDGTAFQLGFPQVIVDKLNEYITGVEGHENYGAFPYQTEFDDHSSSCKEIGICTSFREVAEAMLPSFEVTRKERRRRLEQENLVSTAKTLLELNEKEITISSISTAYVQSALEYFLDTFERDAISVAGCVSPAHWQRLVAFQKGIPLDPVTKAIDTYKAALDKIAVLALYQEFGKK